jgi:hypothetical protein
LLQRFKLRGLRELMLLRCHQGMTQDAEVLLCCFATHICSANLLLSICLDDALFATGAKASARCHTDTGIKPSDAASFQRAPANEFTLVHTQRRNYT